MRRILTWTLVTIAALVGATVVVAAVLWLTLPNVRALANTNPETTAFIELRRHEAQDKGGTFHLRWTWRPLARISPLLQRAVIYTEDARFFQHGGVDWTAVKKTVEHDVQERSLSRGGSTITQQVAKNLYLSPSRNPIRKLREMLIAWRLESALDQHRILEISLHIAEWGPGIFGAEAAARHWFGRSAAELTAAQAARLALALPNPIRRSPRVASRALDRRAGRIVRALRRAGLIDEDEMLESLRALGEAPAEPPPAAAADETDGDDDVTDD